MSDLEMAAPAGPGPKLWVFGLAMGFLLAVSAAYFLLPSLFPFFLAFGLAYAFNPLVSWAESRGVPRTLAVSLLLLALILLAVLLLAFVIPALAREGMEFIENFPAQAGALAGKFAAFANRHGMDLPANGELEKKLGAWARRRISSPLGPDGLGFSSMAYVVELGLNLLIIPVFFFYVLRDFSGLRRKAMELVPKKHQSEVYSALSRVDAVFSSYIHGQLIVAAILSVIFSVGLMLMGVQYGLAIGLLSGFLNLVPYLGQAFGALLAMLMVAGESRGWGRMLAIPAFFAAVNFVEGTFITPQVVGNKVGLSSLEALLAMLVGADIAGLVGLVLAIPLAASLKVLGADMYKEYKRSRLYKQPAQA